MAVVSLNFREKEIKKCSSSFAGESKPSAHDGLKVGSLANIRFNNKNTFEMKAPK